MTTTPPPELQRLLQAAFQEHQRGDFTAAEAGYRRVLAASPDQPDANHLLGVLLDQTGRGEAGAELILRSLSGAPDNPDAHCNLGRVLAGLGRLEEAIASYESALALRPDFPQARFNLGVALRRLGRLDAAIDCYRALVHRHPGHGGALLNLGNALKAAGRPQEAVDCWRRALAAEPGLTAARVNLANAARDAGDRATAEQGLIAAIRQTPDHAEACMSLALLLRGRIPGPGTELAAARAAFLACLARDDLEHQDLATAATAVLLAGAPPVVTEGWGAADSATRRVTAAQAPVAAFLNDPLLHRLLTRTILMDPELEAFLAGLRSAFLDAAGNEGAAGLLEREIHWLVPLALQCFRNEYVYPESGAEAESVEALMQTLRADLAEGAAVDARLVVLGCYRPLYALPGAEKLIGRSAPTWWPVLARTQVEEPQTERRLVAALPRLAGERRTVSEAVRRQYEENPYPRWTGLYRSRPSPFLECLRRQVPSAPLEDAPSVPAPRVLVAGCGTGLHAISSALEYERAQVLAVDLSGPSLAFAQRRAAELGVANIEFLQADLLDLDLLERRFDVIESVGVLHHLADPSAGGHVLRGRLAPGGHMKLGLYSELARGAVVAARRLIAQRGDSPTPAGIRAARDAILRLPADAPAAGVAASGDFYSTSGVRDLLFHVQEHRFTLPDLAALVGQLELEFLGFVLDDSVLRDYRRAEPDDPEARSLERWARYEASHPETFGEMYQFWLRAPAGEA